MEWQFFLCTFSNKVLSLLIVYSSFFFFKASLYPNKLHIFNMIPQERLEADYQVPDTMEYVHAKEKQKCLNGISTFFFCPLTPAFSYSPKTLIGHSRLTAGMFVSWLVVSSAALWWNRPCLLANESCSRQPQWSSYTALMHIVSEFEISIHTCVWRQQKLIVWYCCIYYNGKLEIKNTKKIHLKLNKQSPLFKRNHWRKEL